jgi:hypothetical protein
MKMNPNLSSKHEANTTGGFSQKGGDKDKNNDRKNSTHRNRDDSEEKFEI